METINGPAAHQHETVQSAEQGRAEPLVVDEEQTSIRALYDFLLEEKRRRAREYDRAAS